MTKIRSQDASHIQDRRGQSSGNSGGGFGLDDLVRGGGGGIRLPGGAGGGLGGLAKGGGGMMGLLLMLAVFVLPKLLGGSLGGGTSNMPPQQPPAPGISAENSGDGGDGGGAAAACSTDLEQILCGATNDVQDFWSVKMPESFGQPYEVTDTVFFSEYTDTGCGQATAQTGPFYCPVDHFVYFDLDFLQTLQSQFNAPGDLATQYIVAHEFGHHVQNITGINAQVQQAQQQDPSRANQYSVALELQADCFAGVWAGDASANGQFDDPGEVEEALNAASAVGDDTIQQKMQGRVDPESWTHGSSAQRVQWFQRGFTTGDPQQCNTFNEVL